MSEKENIREIILIGRDANSNFIANDPSVSRQHAQIIDYGTYYTVVDLGSSNGTYVNGRKVSSETTLHSGDILKVGNVTVPWEQLVQPLQKQKKTKVLLAILLPVIGVLLIGGALAAYFIWWRGDVQKNVLTEETQKAATELRQQQQQNEANVKQLEEQEKEKEAIEAQKSQLEKEKKLIEEEKAKIEKEKEKAEKERKEAQKKANNLESELNQKKADAQNKEEEAYNKCKGDDATIEACEAYLLTYPTGKYVDKVRAKKAELKDAESQKKKIKVDEEQAQKAQELNEKYKAIYDMINKLSENDAWEIAYDFDRNTPKGKGKDKLKDMTKNAFNSKDSAKLDEIERAIKKSK